MTLAKIPVKISSRVNDGSGGLFGEASVGITLQESE